MEQEYILRLVRRAGEKKKKGKVFEPARQTKAAVLLAAMLSSSKGLQGRGSRGRERSCAGNRGISYSVRAGECASTLRT